MNRSLFAAMALVLSLPLGAESLTYRETSQGKTTTITGVLTRLEEGGLSWEVVTTKDTVTRSGRSGSTLVAMETTTPDTHWLLKAEAGQLKVSGSAKGKPVSGSLALGGKLWSTDFDEPLRVSVQQKLTTALTFFLVNPLDVKAPTEMVLIPDGRDTVEGRSVLRFKLSLPGAMSLFWSAQIWADPATGNQVQYKGNRGPNTPDFLLIIERQP